MKAGKWRDFSDDELRQRVRELTEEIFNLRFQLSMGVAKSPARMRQARKDLARAKTVLGERVPVAGLESAAKAAGVRAESPTGGAAARPTAKSKSG